VTSAQHPTPIPTLGMGILSWRGSHSLDNALHSYAKEDLFSLFDRRAIILPDPDGEIITLAKKHPLELHTFPKNIGIAGGMKAIAENLPTDYILFLENDCPLIENFAEAKRQITLALDVLQKKQAFMARLRSRRLPGEHFTTLDKYKRYWGAGVLPKYRRSLRPAKAKRLSGTAIYVDNDEAQKHPEDIQLHSQHDNGSNYLVGSNIMPWTNQSILIRREAFLDRIIPYVKSQPLRRTINGFHNIEIELNRSDFWVQSNHKIFCPPGLFTHKRLEYRGYA